MRWLSVLPVFLLMVGFAPAQEEDPSHPGVDQNKVDKAIEKSIQWLRTKEADIGPYNYHDHIGARFQELVLYTMLHAKVPPEDPLFQRHLKEILKAELHMTYVVAFHAMLLTELDPVKYQWRIAQCAQFLVDNQCDNGQWGYGRKTHHPRFKEPKEDVPTGGSKKKGSTSTGKKPKKIIQIGRQRKGEAKGDNSNTQIAALGLRACMQANVFPPRETAELALHWWNDSQHKDGGWGYYGKGDGGSYGSMTAGGIGCIVIYSHLLGLNWRTSGKIKMGVAWMIKNFTVEKNPGRTGDSAPWFYYYLYAMERAGILTKLATFGKIDWYKEGANRLIDTQKANGSWDEGTHGGAIKDVCFAVLFLRRATRPMVSSTDGRFRNR